jgi:hypothetical protein
MYFKGIHYECEPDRIIEVGAQKMVYDDPTGTEIQSWIMKSSEFIYNILNNLLTLFRRPA